MAQEHRLPPPLDDCVLDHVRGGFSISSAQAADSDAKTLFGQGWFASLMTGEKTITASDIRSAFETYLHSFNGFIESLKD